jgi:glycosyltransferase involved in cell wall biosynthesis
MKLSIITINRNNVQGLIKTIESVVSQTFSDFEYIVIDGGSTDGSVEMIKNYKDKITYWISEPDKGIYNAMNKGILNATGDYCLFLNSGDWLYNKSVIQRFIQKNSDIDIIYGNVVLSNANEKQTDKKYHTFVPYDLMIGTIVHQVIFFKRILFDKYGLYDETLKIASDWKFCLEVVVLHDCTIEHIDKFVSYYDCTGISNSMNYLDEQERSNVLSTYFDQQVINDYQSGKLVDITRFFRLTQWIVQFLYILISFINPLKQYKAKLSNKLPTRIQADYVYNFKVNAILRYRYYRSLYYFAKKIAAYYLRKTNIQTYY